SVTVLAGYSPGGLVDVVARQLVDGMKARFPNGIVVINRPGAAGAVAMAEVMRAQPDGYTFILTPASALIIGAQTNDFSYKTPDDFAPIMNVVSFYSLMAVRTESEFKTARDLVSEA